MGIMHLQDKLDQTNAEAARKTSIGIYNLDLIKPPIVYTAVLPSEVKFCAVVLSERMSLDEVLEKHLKGKSTVTS
jgi:phenylalanyl-tRNA synthetase beta chain